MPNQRRRFCRGLPGDPGKAGPKGDPGLNGLPGNEGPPGSAGALSTNAFVAHSTSVVPLSSGGSTTVTLVGSSTRTAWDRASLRVCTQRQAPASSVSSLAFLSPSHPRNHSP